MLSYELLQSLVPEPDQTFDRALAWDLLPSLKALASTPQDPIYHAEGDVWTHTVMVCDHLTRQKAYHQASPRDRFVLFFAALLHDVSKPQCTKTEDDGRITSKGHSAMGAIDTRVILWYAGVPFDIREEVCQIIEVHQLPFFVLGHDRQGRRPEFITHQLSWQTRLDCLCAVARADMMGRTSIHQQDAMDNIALFEMMAQEEACWKQPKAFCDVHTRLHYVRSQGLIPLETPFHQEAGSQVTVMCGLPASGKNTWVEMHCPGLPVMSYDDAKAELGIKPGDTPGAAVHMVRERAKALLRIQAPFVWNATHLTPLMRSKTLDLLHRYHANINIVYLEQPPEVIFQRNTRRDSTLSNRKIESMLQGWTIPKPTEAHRVHYEATGPTATARPSRPRP